MRHAPRAKGSRIGDEGQRYEIASLPISTYGGTVGWSNTLKGARDLRGGILLAPSVTEAWIVDRDTGKRIK